MATLSSSEPLPYSCPRILRNCLSCKLHRLCQHHHDLLFPFFCMWLTGRIWVLMGFFLIFSKHLKLIFSFVVCSVQEPLEIWLDLIVSFWPRGHCFFVLACFSIQMETFCNCHKLSKGVCQECPKWLPYVCYKAITLYRPGQPSPCLLPTRWLPLYTTLYVSV